MKTAIEIKAKIMAEGLNKVIHKPAKMLSYVDGIYDTLNTFKNTGIAYSNEEMQSVDKLLGKKNMFIPINDYLKVVNKNAKKGFVYVFDELYLPQMLVTIYEIANGKIPNLLPVMIDTGVLGDDFLPTFISRTNSMQVMTGYRRYFVTLGEGWGDLENNLKAIDTEVDQKLFDLWSNNIVEITARREKIREDYFNSIKNKKNEDKQ